MALKGAMLPKKAFMIFLINPTGYWRFYCHCLSYDMVKIPEKISFDFKVLVGYILSNKGSDICRVIVIDSEYATSNQSCLPMIIKFTVTNYFCFSATHSWSYIWCHFPNIIFTCISITTPLAIFLPNLAPYLTVPTIGMHITYHTDFIMNCGIRIHMYIHVCTCASFSSQFSLLFAIITNDTFIPH